MSEQTTSTKQVNLDHLDGDPTWPTKRQDVLAALTLIQRHQARTGEPLRLLEGWGEAAEGHIWVQLPEWIIELGQHYRALYGEAGEPILQRVLKTLLPVEPLH